VFTKDDSSKIKLKNELFLLKNLRHPNIVKLFENIEANKYHMLFMELCTGGDLLHYVRRRRGIEEDLAKHLFRQLILGIGYLHSRSIIHRDIKLENILLDNLGTLKICDLGVSKLTDIENMTSPNLTSKQTLKECCGTPAYMAPEVIRAGTYEA